TKVRRLVCCSPFQSGSDACRIAASQQPFRTVEIGLALLVNCDLSFATCGRRSDSFRCRFNDEECEDWRRPFVCVELRACMADLSRVERAGASLRKGKPDDAI